MSNAFGVTSSAIKAAELTKSTSGGGGFPHKQTTDSCNEMLTDRRSYMDSDLNPHKKNKFKPDVYLT